MIVPGSANSLLLAGGGYQISRSVRLRNSATGYFSRTIGATATNAKIGTLSMWVKRGGLTSATGNSQYLIQTGISATTDSGHFTMFFTTSDTLSLGQYSWAGYSSTQVFRDPSAWYHIVLSYNSTLASNNLTIYVNGVQIAVTSVVQNTNWAILSGTEAINIGRHTSVGRSFDGYLTEINLIDGQALTPSSFGETDSVTGVWKPKKYTGTYGTNGFYLNFSDNSAATAAAIGKDYSGNGNNWTPNNISVTAGTTYDSMLDVPTLWADGGNGRGNYCTLNPLNASMAPTSGNLNLEPSGTSGNYPAASTLGVSTGKWYFEVVATNYTGSGQAGEFGFRLASASAQSIGTAVGDANGFAFGMSLSSTWYSQKYAGAATNLTGLTSATTGTVGMIAVDFDTGNAWVGKDGAWYNSGNPANGANPTITGITAGTYVATIAAYRDATRNYAYAANFGQRTFSYTPPSGFKALNTQNLPTPTIPNGAKYMAATTYTGNGTTLAITNSGSMQPDLVWIKVRSIAASHVLQDSVRGPTAYLQSNATAAENTNTSNDWFRSFNSNGFTVAGSTTGGTPTSEWDGNGNTYVAWQWQAGAGTTSSNTSGTITSTVSVGATQGFSVVTWTGTGANATIGHGLGVAPSMIICKHRNAVDNWIVYHTSLGGSPNYLWLNLTSSAGTSSAVWNTFPTSSVFGVGTDNLTNLSGGTYVAYCFAAIKGYSAFGSYTGNGSADGPFVYCGFLPRWVLIKRTDSTSGWLIIDTSRQAYNVQGPYLLANTSDAETTGTTVLDVLSNGFKSRSSSTLNTSSGTYIFAAFAESPFNISLAR